ncbi:MAG: class I SAM-dependent methyltransferase [Candidatus Helarchaeota archaeon]
MDKNINDLKKYFNFDIFADIYDKTREISNSFQSIISLIFKKSGFKKGDRPIVLEVGIGTGMVISYLPNLRNLVPKYIGIDISKKMLKILQKKYKNSDLEMILADAYYLPFKKDKFDLSLMVRAVHILPRWKDAIREVKRCIKDNRLLVIITGGPGKKILNKCPSNDKYLELREKYGYPLFYYGADWAEIPEFIKNELNAQIEIFEGTYSVKKSLKKSLIEFEDQSMTWHTQVPKNIHDKIVQELKEFLLRLYGNLDIEEQQLGCFNIGFIKFNKSN